MNNVYSIMSVSSKQPLELLVEKVIVTSDRPMGAGESFRRVLECVASGILLEGEMFIQLSTRHEGLYTGINIKVLSVYRRPWN